MSAVIPVRPIVDAGGICWTQRDRFWWAGEFAFSHYHVTHGDPRPGEWTVLHSDGRSPFREITGPDAEVVVSGLKAWIVAGGGEVPA